MKENYVNARRIGRNVIWLGAVALAFGIGTVVGEQAPPTGNTGTKVGEPEAIDLAPWANDMKGRELRMRRFDVAPGGILGIHSHDDRPDVSYLVQGTLTEYRAGDFMKVRPSETLHSAGKGVTHWVVNNGNTPAILIVADVFKNPAK
jgi:quercetin dioxygenase-like cupin family protein